MTTILLVTNIVTLAALVVVVRYLLLQRTITFLLPEHNDGNNEFLIPVTVVLTPAGFLEIRAAGHGEFGAVPGYGAVAFLEQFNGELVLRVNSDINTEGPTHTINLIGARESHEIAD